MTFNEFLAKLKVASATKKMIVLKRGSRNLIRSTCDKDYCPIEVAANEAVAPVHITAINIGLNIKLAREIVYAADESPGHDPQIREALLKACGLLPLATA